MKQPRAYNELSSVSAQIGPEDNHRAGREEGALVYPVYSRRSRGLSVGVNLFPDKKHCSFDCPYCEVFPFETPFVFSADVMEKQLRAALAAASGRNGAFRGEGGIRDICFSGNGEPSISPNFKEAVERAAALRDELVPEADLVVITNGTGLLNMETFDFLARSVHNFNLKIWLKLDAGSESWFSAINSSNIDFLLLKKAVLDFAAAAPVVLQTMLCGIAGKAPPLPEEAAWEALVLEIAALAYSAAGGGIYAVQLYGKARPAPNDPLASSLPLEYLESRAASLRKALENLRKKKPDIPEIPIEVFP